MDGEDQPGSVSRIVLLRRDEGRWNAHRAAARSGLIAFLLSLSFSGAAQTPEGPKGTTDSQGGAHSSQNSSQAISATPTQLDAATKDGNASKHTDRPPPIDAPKLTDWIVAGAAAINLIFSGGLVISTVWLWRETKRLAKGAEDQHGTLKDSVAQATRAADAATDAAKGRPILERAYVFLSEKIDFHANLVDAAPLSGDVVILGSPRSAEIKIRFVNHGKTPALLTHADCAAVYWRIGFPLKFTHTPKRPVNITIGAGRKWTYPLVHFDLTKESWEAAKIGDGKILVFGRVCYEDIFGELRETGYCWEYNFSVNKFIQADNRELNYHT